MSETVEEDHRNDWRIAKKLYKYTAKPPTNGERGTVR